VRTIYHELFAKFSGSIVEDTCRSDPCLWLARVAGFSEKVGIYLGERSRRPFINLPTGRKPGNFKVIFLSTSGGRKPEIHLSLCNNRCDSFKWGEKAKIFVRDGRWVFSVPPVYLKDSKLVEFCGRCSDEIKQLLSEITHGR